MEKSTLILLLLAPAGANANGRLSDGVRLFVEQTLHTSIYKRADADLDGDGQDEHLVYITDPKLCGSGGCTLLILSGTKSKYRVVMRTTVTNPPISILGTSTHGWRDVGVTVQGGGIVNSHIVRMRFNGRRYPTNPTILSSRPLHQSSGRVAIDG